MKVTIFLGSESDADMARGAVQILKEFGVPFILEVSSAHRSPERTIRLVKYLEKETAVFVAFAGKAAHLAGVVAAHTTRPVIGVPVASPNLNGWDALLSTVQMPKGVPVACMGLGESGAVNAALLAVEILSLADKNLAGRLSQYRADLEAQVESSSKKIKEGM